MLWGYPYFWKHLFVGKFWGGYFSQPFEATEHDHHEFGVEGLQQLHPVGPKQITPPKKKNDVDIYVGMYKTVDTDMICMCKYNVIYIHMYMYVCWALQEPIFYETSVMLKGKYIYYYLHSTYYVYINMHNILPNHQITVVSFQRKKVTLLGVNC